MDRYEYRMICTQGRSGVNGMMKDHLRGHGHVEDSLWESLIDCGGVCRQQQSSEVIFFYSQQSLY